MNRRLVTILAVAAVAASAASYLVYRALQTKMAVMAAAPGKIVVAARRLEIGTLIREGDLKHADWIGELPKGSTTRKETLTGRGVVSTVFEGEPVMENRLAAAGAGGGLAATIPVGMRACAVKVNEVVGLSGFVVPGMRVDVLVTVPASQIAGARAKTVLQNVEVLSAGTNIQKDAEGRPVQVQVVNLLVTPEQAETLSLASNETRIQLVLRNPLDTNVAKTAGSSMTSMLAQGEPGPRPAPRPPVAAKPAPRPAPPNVWVVEVLSGSTRSVVKFDVPESQSSPGQPASQ
jgi:pilus assembly protein CpaB